MQVQPMYNSHPHPASPSGEQNHTHSNGVHSDSRQHYSTSTNGHYEEGNMNYQQNPNAYGHGHGQPQQQPPHQQQQQQHNQQQQNHQQQYHYQANQLPPLNPTGGEMWYSMPPPPAPSSSMAGPTAPVQTYRPPSAHPSQSYQPTRTTSTSRPPAAAVASAAAQQAGEPSYSGNDGKYKYELKVEQQPQRARMCGFGDKDRRPITPPPCVRLIITDLRTGKIVKPDEVEGTFFVLQVDLWDSAGTREVNLVRSSGNSPAVSISTATTTSFPPTNPEHPSHSDHVQPHMFIQRQPLYGPSGSQFQMSGGPLMPGMGYPPHSIGFPADPYGAPYMQSPMFPQLPQSSTPVNTNMFTRNLIGSLTVNASILNDTNNEPSYWFVLQDLSVRTEGHFQLKMNFINVGDGQGGVNKSRAPVLAYTRSDAFQVFSAKKFPGVIESTDLSKKFAHQGIKIPIRKDNNKGGDDDDENE